MSMYYLVCPHTKTKSSFGGMSGSARETIPKSLVVAESCSSKLYHKQLLDSKSQILLDSKQIPEIEQHDEVADFLKQPPEQSFYVIKNIWSMRFICCKSHLYQLIEKEN